MPPSSTCHPSPESPDPATIGAGASSKLGHEGPSDKAAETAGSSSGMLTVNTNLKSSMTDKLQLSSSSSGTRSDADKLCLDNVNHNGIESSSPEQLDLIG